MKYHVEFDIDFKRNPYEGLYIALEGVDGSGKTLQSERLAEFFRKQGKEVVTTREPRKEVGMLSDLIHDILFGKIKMSPVAVQYLFTADRILNQEETVIPALKAGKVVVSDRSFWSIIPYALPDIGADFSKAEVNYMLIAQGLLSMYNQTIVPDAIFYLDISVDTAMKRLSHKSADEREIYEKREKIEKHAKGYHWLLENFPQEFTVIPGEADLDTVFKEIIARVESLKK